MRSGRKRAAVDMGDGLLGGKGRQVSNLQATIWSITLEH
jgi:hypothetical protein